MENNNKLMAVLDNVLKKKLNNIVFLELNKDVSLGSYLKVQDSIPLPIKSDDLLEGIKLNEYRESIDFREITEAMIYLIGCDREFKYNNYYVDLLKKVDSEIDTYILARALDLSKQGEYINALVYFRALDTISDNHKDVARYNLANTLRQLALYSKERGNSEDHDLYHGLSYNAFLELCRDFPEIPYAHYHLGFHFFEDGRYEDAIEEWQETCRLLQDDDIKDEVVELIKNAKACLDFERGKEEIIDGDVLEGLKILIPLSEKYPSWAEIRYFTALGYRKFGNYKKAQIMLYELLEEGQEFAETYNELGLCYFSLGEIEQSIEYFKTALSMMQDHPAYLCNLGMALYESGDLNGAKANIYRAYDLDPDDELTFQLKSWIDGAS